MVFLVDHKPLESALNQKLSPLVDRSSVGLTMNEESASDEISVVMFSRLSTAEHLVPFGITNCQLLGQL